MKWKNTHLQEFWGELAPADHVIQLYENETVLLNTLEGFAGVGFLKQETVVVIATGDHLSLLDQRLELQGFRTDILRDSGQYFAIDILESLGNLMIADKPDKILLKEYVATVMKRAQAANNRVRIFDELSAHLWINGKSGMAKKLERLWHRHHPKAKFCLFEAYPRSCLPESLDSFLASVARKNTKLIDGGMRPSTQIYYQMVRSARDPFWQESA